MKEAAGVHKLTPCASTISPLVDTLVLILGKNLVSRPRPYIGFDTWTSWTFALKGLVWIRVPVTMRRGITSALPSNGGFSSYHRLSEAASVTIPNRGDGDI